MLAVQKFCAKLHVPIEKKIEHNKPQFFKRFIIFKNTYIFCYFSTVPHNPGIPIIHVLLFFRTKDLWKSVEKLDGLAVEVLSLWQQKEVDKFQNLAFDKTAYEPIEYETDERSLEQKEQDYNKLLNLNSFSQIKQL